MLRFKYSLWASYSKSDAVIPTVGGNILMTKGNNLLKVRGMKVE